MRCAPLVACALLAACPSATSSDGGLVPVPDADDAGAPPDASVGEEPTTEAGPGGAFLVPPLVGRAAASAFAVNVVPARELDLFLEVGDRAEALETKVPVRRVVAAQPVALSVEGLEADGRYLWRLSWRSGGGPFVAGPLHSLRTAKSPTHGFTFTLQADSHMDENSVAAQYTRTLENVRADAPDFHVDLGDTFMCEKHGEPLLATSPPAPNVGVVTARYLFERGNFGVISTDVPLFLVNGNHEGELGTLSLGQGDDLATWAARARQQYFLPPYPDAFFSGDERTLPFVGRRGAFYAFTWGDALFVMLDPFWDTTLRTGNNGWAMTLGAAQYTWLAQVLRRSPARWKFVFLHNLVGGLDGQQRGGVEAAPYFEWGGRELDGGVTFSARRPLASGWQQPIHELLVETNVTAVFHGHDHLYAHQTLDGIVYQEVPQPSARNTNNAAMLAGLYHYDAGTLLPSAGHLRVTVTPTSVTTQYVRSWLPSQENATRRNAEVAHTWSLMK